jgi:anaerobic magnesium-protoporphyrin IX monomethyl ester cyclase
LLRMRQAAFSMLAMARARGSTVIAAGSDATDHAAEYLQAGADYVLIGEGEETLGELLDVVLRRAQTPLDSILGLAFSRDGQLIQTPRRPDIRRPGGLTSKTSTACPSLPGTWSTFRAIATSGARGTGSIR